MAMQAVEKYMKTRNRPYSANDVALALKDLNKSAVQKSLDQLVAKGSVFVKEYGKQKVYCATQDESVVEEEDDVDAKISRAQGELSRVKEQLLKAEAKRKSLTSSKTTQEATNENRKLEEDISELRNKLAACKNDGGAVTREEMSRMTKKRDAVVKEYKKRKRIGNDILDQILEGYPKTKKQLFEDIGIETDESVQMPKLV